MRAPLLRRQSPEGDGARCDAPALPVPEAYTGCSNTALSQPGMPERRGRRLAGAPKSGNGIIVSGLSDFWWMLNKHQKITRNFFYRTGFPEIFLENTC